jgi:hypothetical protein
MIIKDAMKLTWVGPDTHNGHYFKFKLDEFEELLWIDNYVLDFSGSDSLLSYIINDVYKKLKRRNKSVKSK